MSLSYDINSLLFLNSFGFVLCPKVGIPADQTPVRVLGIKGYSTLSLLSRYLIEKGLDINNYYKKDYVINLSENHLEDSLISILNIKKDTKKRKALLDYIVNKK